MSASEAFRPTLLVGVGGTGCRIATRVASLSQRTTEGRAGKIEILAIDTDLNDLQRLSAVPERARVQFSGPENVYRLRERHWSVIEPWFAPPERLPVEIENMSLIEGAAQIRMLTRLALYDAMSGHEFARKLERPLTQLAQNDATGAYRGQINILMCGSLAGATGSGAFFLVALFLKEVCRRLGIQTTVRGVFLMPDVFVRSGALPSDQIQNVLANGYASIKELNAINILTSRPDRMARFDLALHGRSGGLAEGEMPFESVTLIDFETSTGKSLGQSIQRYADVAARAAYLLIFSPIGSAAGSSDVNNAPAKLGAAANGVNNIYSSIGISAVVYPVDSVREYLTARLALNSVQGDWVRLNRMFRTRLERYQRDRDAGRTGVQRPTIEEAYVADLLQLAREERMAFFTEIDEALHPEVGAESLDRERKPLCDVYLDALLAHIRQSFWKSDGMEEIFRRRPLDATSLRAVATMPETVRQAEQVLDIDFRRLEDALRQRPEDLFINALTAAEDLAEPEWREHHIQKHLISGGPHPVQSRAFLFMLKRAAEERRAKLDPNEIRLQLFRLSNQFDDERGREPKERGTPRVVDDALKAASQGALSKILKNKASEFVDRYVGYHAGSVKRLRDFGDAMVEARSLDLLIDEVSGLIRVFAGLFAEIEAAQTKLSESVGQLERRYASGAGDDNDVMVHADKPALEAAWEALSLRVGGVRIDADVNRQILSALFDAHRKALRERREVDFQTVRDLFWTEVVDKFCDGKLRNDFRDAYDFSVVEAVRREADRAARGDGGSGASDAAGRLARYVDTAAGQSDPLIALQNGETNGQVVKFWAVHPKCKDDLADDDQFLRLFTGAQGTRPLVEPEFSPYELLCYNARVNLELEHLTKLHPGDATAGNVNALRPGRYFNAYRERVDSVIAHDMAGGRFGPITPHIDRNWHGDGVLPEILPEIDDAARAGIAKSYVAARLLGLIQEIDDYGSRKVEFSTVGRDVSSIRRETLTEGGDEFEIFDAFRVRPHCVRLAEEHWSRSIGREEGPLEESPILADLVDAAKLERLAGVSVIRDRAEIRDAALRQLLIGWYGALDQLFARRRSELERRGRDQELKAIAATAWEGAMRRLEERRLRPETLRVIGELHSRAERDALRDDRRSV